MDFIALFNTFKERSIFGRYISLRQIEPLLQINDRGNCTSIIGHSVQQRPIYKHIVGKGKKRVMMWSQMHGNESTTTKALFDLLNFLDSNCALAIQIKNEFTLCIVPILNPDGAEVYTRENANNIDLNRDAQDLSQPESQILRKLFIEFDPNFCYNLHDQRTIYAVGENKLPATVSFLAPSYNEAREFKTNRITAISVICKLNNVLQNLIPGQIGRYDDSFNHNCVGDTFQLFGVPTILFEAGHFQNDYDREETRKYIFIALLSCFEAMNENEIVTNVFDDYLSIPLNKTSFLDIIYKNINIYYDNTIIVINFAVQYEEVLHNNRIVFMPLVEKINELENYYGHEEYDLNNKIIEDFPIDRLVIGQKFEFSLKNGTKFVNAATL